MLFSFFKDILIQIKKADRKVIIIFLSVAILQTISWYFTSRNFFRDNFYFDLLNKFESIDLLEFLYWYFGDFVTFFIIPSLIIIFIFKEKLVNYGVNFSNPKLGFSFFALSVIIMLPVIIYVSGLPEFTEQYPTLKSAGSNWQIFIIYELGLLVFIFAWEFIWRGFMLFGLEAKFGIYAIFIQMIPFVILHNGKPALETFSSIIGALLLGFLALRTRSFIYGFLIHAFILFSIDLMTVLGTMN